MYDISQVDDSLLRQTIRIMKGELRRRGWKGELVHPRFSLLWITRDDGKRFVVYGSTPQTTSFTATAIADNKFVSYHALSSLARIQQPETMLALGENSGLEQFIQKHGKVVVKPIDGAHGKGITVGVSTISAALDAIKVARAVSGRGAIVQAQYQAKKTHELRILCIDGKFIGAIYRQPARVLGDGVHTIRELIELENQKEYRGIPYVALMATINPVLVETYLGQKIATIPAEGEWVNVLGTANYGTGGEIIDATDEVPGWMIEDAEAIAEHLDMPVIGIDFIMSEYPASTLSREQLNPAILEVNRSPSLGIHDEPTAGKPRGAVNAYLNYIGML